MKQVLNHIKGMSPLYSSVGLIYFFAFTSLYVQFPGLLGHNGILPADIFLSRVLAREGMGFLDFPSLLALAPSWGVPVDCLAELLLLLGIGCSLLIAIGRPHPLLFFICWASYLSVYLVGQTFLSFQWDILLLEVGFLSVLTTLLQWLTGNSFSRQGALAWAFRFILFKLMLMSGATKLQAGCPTWEKLTALEYHFATQPLPTALAWFSHQLHPLLLRLGVAATLLVEGPATLLLVAPSHTMRLWGGGLQALLQLMIIATGNYNFFNLLTLALVVPVCEREAVDEPAGSKDKVGAGLPGLGLQSVLVYGFLVFSCWTMFDMTHLPSPNGGADNDVYSLLNEVQVQVRPGLDLQGWLNPLGIAGFVLTIVGILHSTLRSSENLLAKGLYILVLALYVQFSFLSFTSIGVRPDLFYSYRPAQYSLLFSPRVSSFLQGISSQRRIQALHLSSSYGLFRQMTGKGAARADQRGVGGMPASVVARSVATHSTLY